MGCGCGKNKGIRGISPRRPTITAKPSIKVQSTPKSAPKIQALSTGLPAERRVIEKKRREEILKKLGRR
jgi:hypothetical protein